MKKKSCNQKKAAAKAAARAEKTAPKRVSLGTLTIVTHEHENAWWDKWEIEAHFAIEGETQSAHFLNRVKPVPPTNSLVEECFGNGAFPEHYDTQFSSSGGYRIMRSKYRIYRFT